MRSRLFSGALAIWAVGTACARLPSLINPANSDFGAVPSTPSVQVARHAAPFVSVGDGFSCILVQGAVECVGGGSLGQLGNGGFSSSSNPVQVSGLDHGVTTLAAGYGHACAIVTGDDGVARAGCWGENDHGQLGDGTLNNRATPVFVKGLPNPVTAISVGQDHSCAIANGNAWCWGENTSGQLGVAPCSSSCPASGPFQVQVQGGTLPRVRLLASGLNHNCAVLDTLSLNQTFCWGDNTYAELGTGVSTSTSDPSPTGAVLVAGLQGEVDALALGPTFGCALIEGSVSCWGSVGGNIPSVISGFPRIISIAATTGVVDTEVGLTGSLCANDSSGTLWCEGDDTDGEIGGGPTSEGVAAPTAVAGLASGITQFSVSSTHGCASTVDHTYCWGSSQEGERGPVELPLSQSSPQRVSNLVPEVSSVSVSPAGNFACALVQGAVYCWGDNASSQLGEAAKGSFSSAPVQIAGLAKSVAISVGGTANADAEGVTVGHACSIDESGDVSCWGSNVAGELGNNSTENSGLSLLSESQSIPQSVSLPAPASRVLAASGYSCAVVGSSVYCWGKPLSGSGNAPALQQTFSSPPTLLIGNAQYACAIGSFGTNGLLCWGGSVPGGGGESSASLISPSGIPAGFTAVSASTRDDGTLCAVFLDLQGDNELWCWSAGASSATVVEASGASLTAISQLNDSGPVPVQGDYSCATFGSTLECSGSENSLGTLGDGTYATPASWTPVLGSFPQVDQISMGGGLACMIAGGGVYCWGDDSRGQVGNEVFSSLVAPSILF
jgi:alpha-tubulin suppressor-like RCC1 family protein